MNKVYRGRKEHVVQGSNMLHKSKAAEYILQRKPSI